MKYFYNAERQIQISYNITYKLYYKTELKYFEIKYFAFTF